MLAGTWGFALNKSRAIANYIFNSIIDPYMKQWMKYYANVKQADQIFLRTYVWGLVKKNVTIHDSFNCDSLGGMPFPTQRSSYYCHVGGYGCCGPEFLNSSFPHECPYNCRPRDHKEWVFC